MIDSSNRPTRLLRFTAVFARWALGSLLALWLLLTVAWGALHGWIVPRIGEFRPLLETQATRALGVPVRIGGITARSEGLIPSIELMDVVLLDAQGRPALQLPRVVVAPSPRSLLHWGFEQLYIERPNLDIRRLADGRIVVGGLSFSDNASNDNAAADWLFTQGEVIIRGGTLRWSDEQRGAPELALENVDVLLRNGSWQHNLRIAATPPPAWGDRFTLTGRFRAPLLHAHDGDWKLWSGQLFANFSRLDVSRLREHADVGVEIAQGRGALRVWADVQRGQIVGGAADLALAEVDATLSPELQALKLPSMSGRLGGRRLHGGFEFYTQGLQFVTDDGLQWPGGNLRLQYTEASSKTPSQGELRADRLDLAALTQIGRRLPLGTQAHAALQTYAPQGLVEEVLATWRGPADALQQYQVRGKVKGLALATAREAGSNAPGLSGASLDIDMNQAGGKASVSMVSGELILPGAFEDPIVPIDQLSADVRWQADGQRLAVQASNVRFANADMQGELRASWNTNDASQGPRHSRFPGMIDLTGTLSRADGTRVHRYLPLTIPADSRQYVRDAIRAGTASNVQFRLKGALDDIPANDPRQGDFRITAHVKDVTLVYVPPRLQPSDDLPWPALTQLSGELTFDRSSMQVRATTGVFAGTPGVRVSKVEAKIPDLSHTVVAVNADARGPLPELLTILRTSPLARMTNRALDQASGAGNADLQLRLNLPINDIQKSKVQGSVTFAGNDVQVTPETPPLSRVRGTVQFTDTGFSLNGVQARALGGDLRVEGGMRPLPANAPPTEAAMQLRAQGTATAEGLQQARQLGMLSQLARNATGSAPYTLALAFRRGFPEMQVTTSLQGMGLTLPAPLAKAPNAQMPVRFETQLARESLATASKGNQPPPLRDQITLDLGPLGSASYQREHQGTETRVLRGAIAIGLTGSETAPMPTDGVVANIHATHIDVDAWEKLLTQATGSEAEALAAATNATTQPAQDYLPTSLAVRAQTLSMQGRTLHNLLAGGSREGSVWRANLDARELNGYVEFRKTGPRDHAAGRVYARLSRLKLPQSEASQVETMLQEQPGTLPALDIVVDDFELRGLKLGRVEIEAQNRGGGAALSEWQLSKFNIVSPEATFASSGNWSALASNDRTPRRRTAMNFRLDIRDSGDLLARFGMENVVRRGKGRLEGQVAWMGAPINPDYRTMSGQINLNVESGQFLKADPGLAKLLGVLSLQSLPRRLTLDFRDVFSEGFAFDFVRGDVRIEQGVAITNNLQMKGVNAAVLMEGSANINNETQDLRVVIIPEINAMTASLVATAINPVMGLGSFLAQVFLRGPLIEAATQEFKVEGTWADPQIVRVSRRGRETGGTPAPSDATPASRPSSTPAKDPS